MTIESDRKNKGSKHLVDSVSVLNLNQQATRHAAFWFLYEQTYNLELGS